MKKLLNNGVTYIKEVLKSYFIYLGLIPQAYDLIQAYICDTLSKFCDYSLPVWFIYSFMLAGLGVSTFIVWNKSKNKIEELEVLLKTGVDYQLSYEIEDIALIDTASHEKRLRDLKSPSKHLTDKFISAAISGIHKVTVEDEIKGLENFIEEAKEFNKLARDFKKVCLFVTNTGIKSDTNITITLLPTGVTTYLDDDSDCIMTFRYPPEPPQEAGSMRESGLDKFVAPLITPVTSRVGDFHRSTKILKDKISVEISLIRPSERVDLIYDGLYVYGDSFSFEGNLYSNQCRDISLTASHLKSS